MSDLSVKIMRLCPDAVIPRYAHEGDAGFDLVAAADVIIEPGETALILTGIAVELPPGYELQVRPRSGITLRTKLRVQLGTVDSNYRGEVGVIVDNTLPDPHMTLTYALTIDGGTFQIYDDMEVEGNSYIIRKGDRIAQGVIAPIAAVNFVEVDELSDTTRGESGFGSTGVIPSVT
jgi:dUTP pyrophosphatase